MGWSEWKKFGGAEFIEVIAYTTKTLTLGVGTYYITAVNYASAGAGTAQDRVTIESVSHGTYELMGVITGSSYATSCYKVESTSEECVVTYPYSLCASVIKA